MNPLTEVWSKPFRKSWDLPRSLIGYLGCFIQDGSHKQYAGLASGEVPTESPLGLMGPAVTADRVRSTLKLLQLILLESPLSLLGVTYQSLCWHIAVTLLLQPSHSPHYMTVALEYRAIPSHLLYIDSCTMPLSYHRYFLVTT